MNKAKLLQVTMLTSYFATVGAAFYGIKLQRDSNRRQAEALELLARRNPDFIPNVPR